ncbi:hypothetical protein SAMN02745165_00688 [Malonomonas rubra DSM 5091]|uniref:Cache domain-containing protein n=1 Tax=Malonomonas rubra DSM 5091 TaxID=1122189 RepID=A0A1M6DI33_MALRU|nr:cache domain-containing protein [Malonomonas rubra]SHI72830.1 hypothetical protein SAMN02745165_00688 [Malonomonas rubra DSM 5091]
MKNNQNQKLGLQQKLFYFSMLGVFVVSILVAAAAMFPLSKALFEQEYQSLKFSHQLQTAQVSQHFREIKSIAEQITSRSRIRQELEKYNAGKISLQAYQDFTRPKLEDALKTSPDVKTICRFDQTGTRVVSVGVAFDCVLYKNSAWREGRTTVTGPIFVNDSPHFLVVAPIRNRQDLVVGKDEVLFSSDGLKHIAMQHSQDKAESLFLLGYSSDNDRAWLNLRNNSEVKKTTSREIDRLLVDVGSGETMLAETEATLFGIEKPITTYSQLPDSSYLVLIINQSKGILDKVRSTLIKVSGAILALLLVSAVVLAFLLKPLEVQALEYQKELEKDIAELQQIIPICMYCKSVRNDEGYWNRIDHYIENMSEIRFSHGICEACMEEKYPDVEKS